MADCNSHVMRAGGHLPVTAVIMAAAALAGCAPPNEPYTKDVHDARASVTSSRPSSVTSEDPASTPKTTPVPDDVENAMLIPSPGQTLRVGGDTNARVTGRDGDFRSGSCRIDTPLPEGYPPPTPPGAIDLKTYPVVRVAEVDGSGSPDRGMNRAFWPLFNHIKKHDIAMTSPVEMRYRGLGSSNAGLPESWSMGFLYRTRDLNDTGRDGDVVVRDTEAVTVVAVGLKGDYSMSLVKRGMARLEDWLADHPEWEVAGGWRSLYYNGPSLMWWNKWAEVQVPVRRSQAAVEAPRS